MLLVNCPYPRPSKFYGQPSSPLYAVALLSHLLSSELSIHFLNYNSWSRCEYVLHAETHFIKVLKELRPNIVALSSTTAALSDARRLAKLARRFGVHFVLLGGPHEDDTSIKTCEIDNNVDVSFAGDGESGFYLAVREILVGQLSSILELTERLRNLNLAKETIYGRCKIHIKGEEPIDVINPKNRMTFDELPFMPRHLMSECERYHYPIFRRTDKTMKATTQVMTQRGCVARCKFCSESQRLFSRGIASLKAELLEIVDCGYEAIFFDDSTFTNFSQSRRHLIRELCDELGYCGVEWGCQTRVDMMDLEMCKEMAAAGCTYIYFGIESFRTDILAALGKHYDTDVIHKALRNCQETGIRVGASLLFGAPNEDHQTIETVETAQSTMHALKRYVDNGTVVLTSLNFYGYYPGTLSTLSLNDHSERDLHPDDWSVSRLDEEFPFSLLEEFPAISPKGLMEIGPEILLRANDILGDVLIGQDEFSRTSRLPEGVKQAGPSDLLSRSEVLR